LNLTEKNTPERPVNTYRAHPAESRMLRNPGSKVKP
jgi:hypothetical protein